MLKADPNFPNSDNDPAFLMSSGSDGWLPKYEVEGGDDNGVLLQNYKKWLAAAQTALANGDKPRYAFSLQAFRLTAFWSASAGPSNSPRRSSRNMIGAKISMPRSGSAFLGYTSRSVSESYSSTSMQTTDTGFVIHDTSGAP